MPHFQPCLAIKWLYTVLVTNKVFGETVNLTQWFGLLHDGKLIHKRLVFRCSHLTSAWYVFCFGVTQSDVYTFSCMRIKYYDSRTQKKNYDNNFNCWFWFNLKAQLLPWLVFFWFELMQFSILFVLGLRIKYDDNKNQNKCVMRTISIVGFWFDRKSQLLPWLDIFSFQCDSIQFYFIFESEDKRWWH